MAKRGGGPSVLELGSPSWLDPAEWATAGLLTLLALALHVTFLTHAGALWRDEANSAAMAAMPTLGDVIGALRYDGFPLAPTLVLRLWDGLGLGATDAGLRCLGLLLGVAFLAVLWLSARWYGGTPPVLSLALVGISPLVVTTVDAIRPYGLGIVAMGVAAPLIARAAAAPSRSRFIQAGIPAVVGVQCLYQNAFLLLAVAAGAVVAAPRETRRTATMGTLAIGAVAALSLLPYMESIRAAREWNVLNQAATDWGQIGRTLLRALEASGPPAPWIWAGAAAFAVRGSRFGVVAAVSAAILFLGAMGASGLPTQPWYYVPLMALAAPALESSLRWTGATRWRAARLVLALVILITGIAAWKQVMERRTNIDRVAEYLEREAVHGDAIVVAPWYFSVSFHRYYQGPVEWITIPPLEDTRIHRYDRIKAAMQAEDPIAPVLDSMGRALDSGHRVWLVGGLPSSPNRDAAVTLSPAPHPITGWSQAPYMAAWSERAAQFLRARADSSALLTLGMDVPVQKFEKVPLVVVARR